MQELINAVLCIVLSKNKNNERLQNGIEQRKIYQAKRILQEGKTERVSG